MNERGNRVRRVAATLLSIIAVVVFVGSATGSGIRALSYKQPQQAATAYTPEPTAAIVQWFNSVQIVQQVAVATKPEEDRQLPFYLPAGDEPLQFVATRFGVELAELKNANPNFEAEVVTTWNGVYLPLEPVQVDTAENVIIRNYGVGESFQLPTAEEVETFLLEREWASVTLIVDLVSTPGQSQNPVVKGWSFRQDPEEHYTVVYVSNGPDQERFLWHELCHEALDSSDEMLVWECTNNFLESN